MKRRMRGRQANDFGIKRRYKIISLSVYVAQVRSVTSGVYSWKFLASLMSEGRQNDYA